jgi:hypothetical protein
MLSLVIMAYWLYRSIDVLIWIKLYRALILEASFPWVGFFIGSLEKLEVYLVSSVSMSIIHHVTYRSYFFISTSHMIL